MHTFSDVIEALVSRLGGPEHRLSAVATALTLPLTTVSSWIDRESIPPSHWPGIVALARAHRVKGVTMARLAAIAAAGKPLARRRQARAA